MHALEGRARHGCVLLRQDVCGKYFLDHKTACVLSGGGSSNESKFQTASVTQVIFLGDKPGTLEIHEMVMGVRGARSFLAILLTFTGTLFDVPRCFHHVYFPTMGGVNTSFQFCVLCIPIC